MTGLYPPWWEGKRFDHAVNVIAASGTGKETRDRIQVPLFGVFKELGTGLVPGHLISSWTSKQGTGEAFDTVYVTHSTGRLSRLLLKSFDQKSKAFAGTTEHVVLLDEEPPHDVRTESAIRTMTSGGVVIITMTPDVGRTPMIDEFLTHCVNRESLPIQ